MDNVLERRKERLEDLLVDVAELRELVGKLKGDNEKLRDCVELYAKDDLFYRRVDSNGGEPIEEYVYIGDNYPMEHAEECLAELEAKGE